MFKSVVKLNNKKMINQRQLPVYAKTESSEDVKYKEQGKEIQIHILNIRKSAT